MHYIDEYIDKTYKGETVYTLPVSKSTKIAESLRGHDTGKTARNSASRHETTQKRNHPGHDTGKTARKSASRHETTQKRNHPGHDAGKTARKSASRTGEEKISVDCERS